MSIQTLATEGDYALVERTMQIAAQLNFVCKIYEHQDYKSGKTSDEAAATLGQEKSKIIKCLFLKDKSGRSYGTILRGCDSLEFKSLATELGTSKSQLRFATPEEIENDTGYKLGGLPVTAFKEKGVPTFVDENVIKEGTTTGSGGTEYHAMEFDATQLLSTLGYKISKLAR